MKVLDSMSGWDEPASAPQVVQQQNMPASNRVAAPVPVQIQPPAPTVQQKVALKPTPSSLPPQQPREVEQPVSVVVTPTTEEEDNYQYFGFSDS